MCQSQYSGWDTVLQLCNLSSQGGNWAKGTPELFLLNKTSDTKYVIFSPQHQPILHQLGILQLNSVLTLSEVSIRSHNLRVQCHKTAPISHSSHKFQASWTSGCPTINERFDNLLELLTEPRKSLYLLVYYKEYNWGTANWKRCIGQGMKESGAGASMPFLGVSPSEHLHLLTNLETYLNPII